MLALLLCGRAICKLSFVKLIGVCRLRKQTRAAHCAPGAPASTLPTSCFYSHTVIVIIAPWRESASELNLPSYRCLSAKLVPTFAPRVSRSQRGGSLRPYSRFSIPEPLLFISNSSPVVLGRLSGPRSRPTTSQKIW
jgi:hypothetical protein